MTIAAAVVLGALIGMLVVLASLLIALAWPRPERDSDSPAR